MLLIHEWLFTDQFLQAAQMLDSRAVLRNMSAVQSTTEEVYRLHKKRVTNTSTVVNVIYFSLCATWYLICVTIGSFIFRMSKFLLILIQVSVFSYCLLHLRGLIDEVTKHRSGDKKSMMSWKALLVNLTAYISSVVLLGAVFFM